MKPNLTACAVLLGSIAAIRAFAAGRLAEVAVVDRDTGEHLAAYYHRGEYWVAGEPGAHYAIYVRNRLGERLLAVTSVDGINVITGQSAGWDQGGYVLDPCESYQITGWRKSDYQVAAFAFTAAPRSYAARTDRPENIGVIGIALFREQISYGALRPLTPQIGRAEPEAAQRSPIAPGPARGEAGARREPEASPPAQPGSKSSDLAANGLAASPLTRGPTLGTAHGEREYSYVMHTSFVRRQSRPDEIIRIRYDSLDNLIAMGIMRPGQYPEPGPNPFPGTDLQGYVPDPSPFDGAHSR